MVDRYEYVDWKDLWQSSEDNDWDLDDMAALIDEDDWREFDEAMGEAYTEYLLGGGEPGSVPWWLVEEINNFLEDHDIRPQFWWAVMYGR